MFRVERSNKGKPSRLLNVTILSTLPLENQCLLLGGNVPNAIAKPPYRRPKAFLLWLTWVYLITIILTTCWRGPLRIKRLDLVRKSLNSKGRGSHIWKKMTIYFVATDMTSSGLKSKKQIISEMWKKGHEKSIRIRINSIKFLVDGYTGRMSKMDYAQSIANEIMNNW